MNNRKIIGFIIANPEGIYQQRLLKGVFSQCEKYGYDVAVFSSLFQLSHPYKEYLQGELNIFELINYDRLDGIITASIPLSEDEAVKNNLIEKIKTKCSKTVISIDQPFDDYETVYTNDRSAFSSIAAHVIDVHGCKRVYVLGGFEGHEGSERRIAGVLDEFEKRGIPLPKENIFYGDFWYSGGEGFAERLAAGELEMPDAVICASDHMAIGLANRLIKRGISVPDQVIVTGYDATAEAAINSVTITTYVPDISMAAAEAVNRIHRLIDPDDPEIPPVPSPENGLRICKSCGCTENIDYVKSCLSSALYNINHNFQDDDAFDKIDIGKLLESYMMENLTSASDPDDCLRKILSFDYLIRPYGHYYLCLREEWLNIDSVMTDGYPERMKTVIHSVPENRGEIKGTSFCTNSSQYAFDTELMLPQLYVEHEKPSVFYFTPVHFKENNLGYSVLQCSLDQKHQINHVFRNWVRYVNNALEMARVQHSLFGLSIRDMMTGLYNRRGMSTELRRICGKRHIGEMVIAFVVDLDGLKYINDTFGHSEGDYAIKTIASAVSSIAKNTEVCVRAGGDEFYIVGIGSYSVMDAMIRIERFNAAVAEEARAAGKPYEISASIGYCCEPYTGDTCIDNIIELADGRMYESKVAKKRQRK